MFLIVPLQAIVTKWLEDFSIRQKPVSFKLDEAMRKMFEHVTNQFPFVRVGISA